LKHTTGTEEGIFAYISAKDQTKGQKARLVSPFEIKTSGSCVQFYYHTFGSDIGTLNVYNKMELSLGSAIWSTNGTLGNQ
jgi:hypothetical protein